MSLIAIENLSLSFSGKNLFNKVRFQISKGDRIGLVGPNGTGKTTLLRILVGEVSPNEGEVFKLRGIRIGYLPQDISTKSSGTLLASVLDSIPGKRERDQRLKDLEIQLEQESNPTQQMALAHQINEIYNEIHHSNIHFSPHRAKQILLGLGFSVESFNTPLMELSGGWKMRGALAGLLFQEPDILLLDEPTNHLDFPSVLWLEEFLLDFCYSLVLICHDRRFLNKQINSVISLEPEGFRTYIGNYDNYIASRKHEETVLEAKKCNQEQKVKEAKRFIERFQAKSTKARQAQSKIKMLKKLELVKTHTKRRVMDFTFPKVPRSGDVVLSIQGVKKSFKNKGLYKDLNLFIKRGERIAVIGKNGVGKTTLLKMIAGEISPDTGKIELGHNVIMSYYAQHHTELFYEKNTILEEVFKVLPNGSISFVRGVCGAFLFSGDEVEKPIAVLSGGERARVALARILVKPGNLLVMDEPTNHLDILSCEVLIKALDEYNGTFVFVSHNHGLINRLATKIWDISDKEVKEYPGNLDQYIYHLKRRESLLTQDFEEKKSAGSEVSEKHIGSRERAKERRRREAEHRKLLSQKLTPLKKELTEIEKRIEELERRELTLSEQLADQKVYKDIKQSEPLINEYAETKKELDELLTRWEYQQEILETTLKSVQSRFPF